MASASPSTQLRLREEVFIDVNRPGRVNGLVMLLVLVPLALAVLWPFALVSPLPIEGYAEQLASLRLPVRQDEALSTGPSLMSGLAAQTILPPLARLMPVELALDLFTALTMLLPALGTVALHRALFRRHSLFALLALLLLYNRPFLAGQLNLVFGLGAALLTLAVHVRAQRRLGPLPLLLLTGSLALLVCFCHPLAFVVLALILLAVEATASWRSSDPHRRTDAVAAGLALVPGFVLLALLAPEALRTIGSPGFDPVTKLGGLLGVFDGYLPWRDRLLGLVLAALFGLGYLTRRLVVHAQVLPALIGLLLLHLAPFPDLEGVTGGFLLAAALLLVAGSDWRIYRPWHRAFWALAFLAVLAWRVATVADVWQAAGG